MKIQVGDTLVYPGHGPITVFKREHKSYKSKDHIMNSVKVLGNGNMTIMFPDKEVKRLGIRPLVDQKEAMRVLKILRSHDLLLQESKLPWSEQYRACIETIKGGDLMEIALIAIMLALNKEPGFGERKMLAHAQSIVSSELALVLHTSCAKMETHVRSLTSGVHHVQF